MRPDPIFHDGHYARYQDELKEAEARREREEERFRELWESNFGVQMAENWGDDWDEKLCEMVRKYPKEPFSLAVASMLEKVAEREAGE